MDKKEKNDAIQEAFVLRQETSNFFNPDQQPLNKLGIIGVGCSKIVMTNLSLKRSLLKTLVTSLRHSKTSRPKSVKIMLIWLISLMSRLFSLLTRTLNS